MRLFQGHVGRIGTGFLGFPLSVYKRMIRWFPRHQVATACFSCSPPDLNFLVPYFVFMYLHNNHCHRVTVQLQLINIIIIILEHFENVTSLHLKCLRWQHSAVSRPLRPELWNRPVSSPPVSTFCYEDAVPSPDYVLMYTGGLFLRGSRGFPCTRDVSISAYRSLMLIPQ